MCDQVLQLHPLITRPAGQPDAYHIFSRVLAEKMNPLSLSPNRFICAVAEGEADTVVGFGQVRPLGEDGWELEASGGLGGGCMYEYPIRRLSPFCTMSRV